MKPARKKRLGLVLLLVLGAGTAVGLTLYALQQNINLFFLPSAIVAGEAPLERTIRVGGLVVAGSVARNPENLEVGFTLTDNNIDTIRVVFNGILPDLFREGQGIVARGKLEAGNVVRAEEVLAKHDENYMPKEIDDGLKASGMWQEGMQ